MPFIFLLYGIRGCMLMPNNSANIDGYAIDNSGFMGLSMDPNFFNLQAPFSLLHLKGNALGVSAQEPGYRTWMRPGITFTTNGDFMYVGPFAHTPNLTDAVICWADNPGSGGGIGPDVLRFIFTGKGAGNMAISGNPYAASDYDGVEVARMTGTGLMGVGVWWTNSLLPQRTLDVVIARLNNPDYFTQNQFAL